MSIISYAQNFEDVMLWRALGHIEHGFYIDIGAQDPIVDSVSLAFHEHGWHGIHVEPTPHYAQMLRQNRPGDTIIQAAVGTEPGLMRFYEIPHTGISTADAEIAAKHRERGFTVQETIVTSITLSSIFSTCPGEIHWLKIDVEGFEQQLLSSWGDSSVRPWIVVVESTLPMTQIETHDAWEPIIKDYGYTPVYFDGLNRYYVSHAHPELKAAFTAPPNVFDGFKLNGTASAPFHRLIEDRLQAKLDETVTHSEQQKALAEKEEQRLHESYSSLNEAYAEHQKDWAQTEKNLSEQSSQAKQALEELRYTHAQRELEFTAQLLTLQQQVEREKAELIRSQCEQERTLHAQLSWLQQERVTREHALHEETSQTRIEKENILYAGVQREQDIAKQFLILQQQADHDKLELVRRHSEQERILSSKFIEQEQAWQHKLLSVQEQLLWLQQERVSREQKLHEQTLQVRQEIENILRGQTQRELEISAQLLEVKLEAEQTRAKLLIEHGEKERVLHDQQFEREKFYEEKNIQARLELGSILNRHIEREQQISLQLLDLQQNAEREKTELLKKHGEQARALEIQLFEREQLFNRQFLEKQEELHQKDQNHIIRAQEIAAEVLVLRQKAAQEAEEQKSNHREQERILSLQHATREDALKQQLQATQMEVHRLEEERTRREQETAAQLLALEQKSQQEKADYTNLLETYTAVEKQLHTEMRSAQQAYADLSNLLEETRKNLEMMHASLSWRMTTPFRKFINIFRSSRQRGPSAVEPNGTPLSKLDTMAAPKIPSLPELVNEPAAPAQRTPAVAEMQSMQPSENVNELDTLEQHTALARQSPETSASSEPFESTISQFANITAKKMPNNATTLSELLALHDQHFIRCAYKTLLGRSPDPEGYQYYLSRVRAGFPKIQIVSQLCLSNEGKSYASDLSGLDVAIKRYQKEQHSFSGMVLNLFNAKEGNSSAERKLRAIENQMFLFDEKNQERFDHIETALSSLHNFIASRPPLTATFQNSAPAEAPAPSAEIIAPSQVKNSDESNNISPRAREFYSKIKSITSNNSQRCL